MVESDPYRRYWENVPKIVQHKVKEGFNSPIRAAVIGGGWNCLRLLEMLRENDLSAIAVSVLGVADPDPDAPGLDWARRNDLFSTTNIDELYTLEGLNTLIDLSGNDETAEYIFKTKPGDCSYLDARTAGLLFNLGRTEIDLAKNEAILAESRLALRNTQVIIDSLPYRIMVINPDKTVKSVNKTFLDWFESPLERVRHRPCYEVRYGYDAPCPEKGQRCYLEEILEHKGIISNIVEFGQDESEKTFDVITAAPIFNEQGEVVHIVEASRDVTDRIRLEREAQKTGTFLQNVIESAVDGIVVIDTKGRVLLFNEGMTRLTGHSAGDIIENGHLSSFYDMDTARENMRKMRSDKYGPPGKLNPTAMTVENIHGEEIPVTLSASIIVIDGIEVGSVGVFTDMREIYEMRKELDEAHLQLVQSEKIASVGRMAAGVAHEINNPLSIIMMSAEFLGKSVTDGTEAQKDVRDIIDQTLRCKEIVSDLLEFSRKTIGQAASFSLEALIQRCLNLLTKLATFHDIKVTTDIPADLPDIIGDDGQLEQVFSNLFTNAADAMEYNGRLYVTARYDPESQEFTVKVADTGPGIPEKYRGKVFDIFFTTKRIGKGTGLGLSISKNIIELHGGAIRFDCPPTGGTVFTIDLPREAMAVSDSDPVFIGMEDQ